jgi:hypothetical protein
LKGGIPPLVFGRVCKWFVLKRLEVYRKRECVGPTKGKGYGGACSGNGGCFEGDSKSGAGGGRGSRGMVARNIYFVNSVNQCGIRMRGWVVRTG